jgi:predicted phosphoribosyltransferase
MRKRQKRLRDRVDAGQRLAVLLSDHENAPDTIVLGLPRGGVPVAAAVASALELPLDILVVRKLGVPGYEEVAFGAIASGGIEVLNHNVMMSSGIDDESINRIRNEQTAELRRREATFRGNRPPLDVTGKTVIVVDDGTATGATMRAAVEALRTAGPETIIAAVGVAPPVTIRSLGRSADHVVSVLTPSDFSAVGALYDDFTQTTDDEVIAALRQPQKPVGQ